MMVRPLQNDQGENISGKRVLKHESYGTGAMTDGEPVVDWAKHTTAQADEHGFDVYNIEKNNEYLIRIVLPKGTVLIRYGPETGRYTAPDGTDYDKLSLPYVRSTVEYHKYRVASKALPVYRRVDKGVVAPMFDSPGGAVQYYHPDYTVRELIRMQILERVDL